MVDFNFKGFKMYFICDFKDNTEKWNCYGQQKNKKTKIIYKI